MGNHMPEPNRHDDPKQWATCQRCGRPIFRRMWGDWMHEAAFPGGSPGNSCRDGQPALPGDVVSGGVVQGEVTAAPSDPATDTGGEGRAT